MAKFNQDRKILVWIDAKIDYRTAPKNDAEAVLREQANKKIQAMARNMNKGVACLLEVMAEAE